MLPQGGAPALAAGGGRLPLPPRGALSLLPQGDPCPCCPRGVPLHLRQEGGPCPCCTGVPARAAWGLRGPGRGSARPGPPSSPSSPSPHPDPKGRSLQRSGEGDGVPGRCQGTRARGKAARCAGPARTEPRLPGSGPRVGPQGRGWVSPRPRPLGGARTSPPAEAQAQALQCRGAG